MGKGPNTSICEVKNISMRLHNNFFRICVITAVFQRFLFENERIQPVIVIEMSLFELMGVGEALGLWSLA